MSRLPKNKTDWKKAVTEAERDKKDLKLPSLLDINSDPAFTKRMIHAVGPQYLEAVQLCLTGRAGDHGNGDVSSDEDVSLDVQREVVEKLRQCNV